MRPGGGASILCLASLLALTLSGCLVGVDDGISTIFGDERVWGEPNDRYLHEVLEARVAGANATTEWERAVRIDAAAPPLVLEKETTGPQGGGGETHDLPALVVDPVEVRFDVAERLGNFSARWSVEGLPNATRTLPATEVFTLTPTAPGMFHVTVELLRDGEVVARTESGLRIRVEGVWSVESSVHPVRVGGSPEPTNYDEMRDTFRVPVHTEWMFLLIETSFRGDYDPLRDGTDVDLGLHGPDDVAIECAATGVGPTNMPHPSAASETIEAQVLAGTSTVHVGALRSDCSGGPYYHNQGPVPYTLVVRAYRAE